MGRVELHFHLLPGVDDGPATMAESLELARAAVADGTATVVTTPHVRADYVTDVAELPERVREMREALAAEDMALRVELGGELAHRMVGRLSQADLDTIAVGPPSGRWVLLEAPFAGFDDDFADAAEELRERGFGIVLAHPERTPNGAATLREEAARGTLLQVNASSLLGLNGPDAEEAARRLVTGGAAAVLASDAHGPKRMPMLTRGVEAARLAGVPRIRAAALAASTPARLLGRGVPRPIAA
jgi:protein-tyrosine phosphatase